METGTLVAHVETKSVLPRTLEVVGESMKMANADATMYVVYGRDEHDRKVWAATFFDSDEAMAWVHASRTFGRSVTGAVLAGQEKATPKLVGVDGGKTRDEGGAAPEKAN